MLLCRIPVAARSKAYFCGPSIAGIVGSNPAEGMDIRLLCLMCVVQVAAFATSWSLVQRRERETVCVCVCVWSINLNSEAAYAPAGL